MPKLTIDGMEVTVEPGTSILQAAEQLGIEIPRFCYHDRLSVPANCRMCLVDVEGAPKPMASCAMPCAEDMKVHTKNETIQQARKGVMEFLLVNHPLDCPICDQGGECDLQDQAVAYGYDRSRYRDAKRAVKDKELGPLVKTVMTRCIQCTRCVRFGDEIAGVNALGVLNRGEELEIGTYVENAMASELSGNLIDICPVGALTSRPYAFTARPWELQRIDSIDVSDAVGANISVHVKGSEIMRILPRLNEAVNEEWISDKARFAYDGLKNMRLDHPYVRDAKGILKVASWQHAFETIAEKVKSVEAKKIGAIVGDLCDAEAIAALKDMMTELGSENTDCRQEGAQFDPSLKSALRFNTPIEEIENADAVLLIGTNLRWEAPLINTRVRKAWLNNQTKVAVIGEKNDLTYPYEYLGAGPEKMKDLMKARSGFAKILKDAKRPVIIVGSGVTLRNDGASVHALSCEMADKFNVVKDDWNGFNFLHLAASRMAALELGFVPSDKGLDVEAMVKASHKNKLDVLYLMGADDLPFDQLGDETFIIYQGHHGDHGAMHADVILPGAAYTEKNATYVNVEGRPQIGRAAVFPPAEAKEDWKIIRALTEIIGFVLPYDNVVQLRHSLAERNSLFETIGELKPLKWKKGIKAEKLTNKAFVSPIENFYITDQITRASATMKKCTQAFVQLENKKTGTNG